jgi:hypothetical protein
MRGFLVSSYLVRYSRIQRKRRDLEWYCALTGHLLNENNTEDTLLNDWDKYNKVKAEELSTERVKFAKRMEILLGDIYQYLREFIDQQQKIQADGENKECLRDLRVVNPQVDMKRIEKQKEDLLDDVYKWILEDDKYAALTQWDISNLPPCRLLWVKGHAGTGKTMLLSGIIRQLSNQPAVLVPTLSYFSVKAKAKQIHL